MRMRKKPNLQRRMEACADLWARDPAALRGRWRTLLPQAEELRVELGCGKGRFTAETAAAEPRVLFAAVERIPDAMVTAMERCRGMGLRNVFFLDGDAAGLSQYFAPGEVDLIYINFCDPWPAQRHAKRRLTHENFLRAYRDVLRDGGRILFRTDNRDLFEWSLFQFPRAGFALSEVTRDLHAGGRTGVMTDYEEKFVAQGIPICRCVATKQALGDIPLPRGMADRMAQWEVRPLEDADEPACEALRRACGCASRDPLPPRAEEDRRATLGFWRGGRLAAVLEVVEGYPRERTLWIQALSVSPEYRDGGLGEAIVSALRESAKDAGYHQMRVEGERDAAFWETAGFRRLDQTGAHNGSDRTVLSALL